MYHKVCLKSFTDPGHCQVKMMHLLLKFGYFLISLNFENRKLFNQFQVWIEQGV